MYGTGPLDIYLSTHKLIQTGDQKKYLYEICFELSMVLLWEFRFKLTIMDTKNRIWT
jgi:hypothetical protein